MRVLFHKFSKHYDMWSRAVKCSAVLGKISHSRDTSTGLPSFLIINKRQQSPSSKPLTPRRLIYPKNDPHHLSDVLLSLALYSSSHETTRPEIVVSEEPFLTIEDGSHPTLMPSFSPGEFIPNDTTLGGGQVCCFTYS